MEWVPDAPTPPPDNAGDLAPWEIGLAGAIVAGFVATHPWLREEQADLVQECLVHWLVRRPRYSEARGASAATFMRSVLQRHLVDVERKRTAEKRSGASPVRSLDQRVGEGTSLRDTLRSSQDQEATALLTVALEQARSRLTPEQRALTNALMSGRPMAEIARATNRARSSLYLDLNRIRSVFREEGLDEFL
jgi:DNA-directed RNA polymerase specialized sigma24 family protein